MTIKTVRHLPKSYRWIITNSLLNLAKEVVVQLFKAEKINIHKDMSIDEFRLRQSYLIEANSSLQALQEEIVFLYYLIDAGNTTFKNKEEYDSIFDKYFQLVIKTMKLIDNVIEKDKITIKKLKHLN